MRPLTQKGIRFDNKKGENLGCPSTTAWLCNKERQRTRMASVHRGTKQNAKETERAAKIA